jgi:flagellar biosynthesis protein FlhA
MVVSRVGKEHDVGSQIGAAAVSTPRALGLVAGIVLGLLGLIPGMPTLVFLVIAGPAAGARASCRAREGRRQGRP